MGVLVTARAFEEKVELRSRRGNRLVGLWRPPTHGSSPAVILCHGMESTKQGTKHGRLAEALGDRGLGTLRFDFSYVGESEGDFEDLTFTGEVEDLGGAWDFVTELTEGPIGLFGSSMGGTVAILFAATEPKVAALATVAAVAHPERILEEIRPDELEEWSRGERFSLGGVRLKRAFLEDVRSLDVIGACRSLRCPTFIAHGDADSVVPIGDGREIAATLGAFSRLKVYPGANHRFSKPSDLESLLDDCLEHLTGILTEE